jgi:two-component system NtrC family sensor kinase
VRPIRALIRGTQSVGEMQLDRPVDLGGGDEMAALAEAFNAMQRRLKTALDEVRSLTHVLEERVKERTAQLEAAQKQLIQNDRMVSLGQLAASVAHEINNPIAGVLNFSVLMERLLQDDGIPKARVEDFRDYLRSITEETTHVGRIVSDLLSFSRRPAYMRMAADLNCIVKQTAALVAHKLELAGIELRQQLDPELPKVPCDGGQVQQVVINLLMNAAEASPVGGVVEVTTNRSEDQAILIVRDSGVGISAEQLPHIFEPFYTTKENGKGVGLGLWVVYGIVQAHGGKVEVASDEGNGTTFRVLCPLNVEQASQEARS